MKNRFSSKNQKQESLRIPEMIAYFVTDQRRVENNSEVDYLEYKYRDSNQFEMQEVGLPNIHSNILTFVSLCYICAAIIYTPH